MKYQDMKIGGFYRFDYVSSSPEKTYKKPVKINLTDARRMELIASVQAKATEGEKRFCDLLAEADVKGGLTDMVLEHDKLESARPKGAQRSARQVELEKAIKAEWQRIIGAKRDGSTMTTGEQFFYRQYKAPKIEQSDTGKIYGCLVSKTLSQSGEVLFTFLRLAPVKAEADKVDALDAAERAKVTLA